MCGGSGCGKADQPKGTVSTCLALKRCSRTLCTFISACVQPAVQGARWKHVGCRARQEFSFSRPSRREPERCQCLKDKTGALLRRGRPAGSRLSPPPAARRASPQRRFAPLPPARPLWTRLAAAAPRRGSLLAAGRLLPINLPHWPWPSPLPAFAYFSLPRSQSLPSSFPSSLPPPLLSLFSAPPKKLQQPVLRSEDCGHRELSPARLGKSREPRRRLGRVPGSREQGSGAGGEAAARRRARRADSRPPPVAGRAGNAADRRGLREQPELGTVVPRGRVLSRRWDRADGEGRRSSSPRLGLGCE